MVGELRSRKPCSAAKKKKKRASERGRSEVREDAGYVAGFEDGGREPCAKGCRQPLEAGKAKELDSSPEPPEGAQLYGLILDL